VAEPVAVVAANDQAEQHPPVDVASLPSIESITASTDIRDFLKPGVPLALSRAALHRVWTSDPAIRDFIEIAENQWDFTNNSIPGFGAIDPADVPRLLAQLMGEAKDKAEAVSDLLDGQPDTPKLAAPEPSVAQHDDAVEETPENKGVVLESAQESHRNSENDAVQNEEAEADFPKVRHGHGSALPT
jgi:hypothetical protein